VVTSSRRGGKEGETVGAPGGTPVTDHPSHEGRCRLTRRESTWLSARISGLITVAGQRRNGRGLRGGTGFATWRVVSLWGDDPAGWRLVM
jgi:hypothetical protein